MISPFHRFQKRDWEKFFCQGDDSDATSDSSSGVARNMDAKASENDALAQKLKRMNGKDCNILSTRISSERVVNSPFRSKANPQNWSEYDSEL
jgi:hypothetical protein